MFIKILNLLAILLRVFIYLFWVYFLYSNRIVIADFYNENLRMNKFLPRIQLSDEYDLENFRRNSFVDDNYAEPANDITSEVADFFGILEISEVFPVVQKVTVPLVVEKNIPIGKESFLSEEGILQFTNVQRREFGLGEFKAASLLSEAALTKTKDMLDRQYFEHDSPDGKGVGDLVTEVGYEFIIVGENLALGNFESDEDLVLAWMNSPGHRDNILNEKYTDIGIGLIKGIYQRREVWIAVQHFAKPLSDCLAPDILLETQIQNNRDLLIQKEAGLKENQEELESHSKEDVDDYNEKVRIYNSSANNYNELAEKIKKDIELYNESIKNFNNCISN